MALWVTAALEECTGVTGAFPYRVYRGITLEGYAAELVDYVNYCSFKGFLRTGPVITEASHGHDDLVASLIIWFMLYSTYLCA
jgi:hypothetical protein